MSNQKKYMLYDEKDRGAPMPPYTEEQARYRSDVLTKLQYDYVIREQTHMELNDMCYSEYYLRNRQQDFAYNPPRKNPQDSRIVSGITHEKDNTILSILTEMNFQPKVRIYDNNDIELQDAGTVLTAILKKSLIKEKFNEKLAEYLRVNISQGNVFVEEKPNCKKFKTKKIQTNKTEDPFKMKWNTIIEKDYSNSETTLIPNTAVFLSNLLEPDLHKQDHITIVMHMPRSIVETYYKDFPLWKNVPQGATRIIPQNVSGIWSDYYIQQPADKYVEVIIYQSEVRNEYNVFLNGVMMYPIQVQDGMITGFPLTYISPSGKYSIIKGDNERIPFFAYGKSVPSKTEVKEETMNELMRLMVFKMRQAARPPVGNNSDKILPANIWDPGVVTPDVRKDDLSILTPNSGITSSDFSFYELISTSINESSVSISLEGGNQESNITATQFLDQKKQSLKKLGLSIDNTIAFLKEFYWLRLFNEIQKVTEKKTKYNHEDEKLIEAFEDLIVEDGNKEKIHVKMVDSNIGMTEQDVLDEEEESKTPTKILYTRPDWLQNLVNNLKDKMYIDVIAEPEGQNQSLISILFNLLTGYANLRGGVIHNLNFEYIDKIVGENSGFESDKLFLKTPPPMAPNIGGAEGEASKPIIPRDPSMNGGNSILSNAK